MLKIDWSRLTPVEAKRIQNKLNKELDAMKDRPDFVAPITIDNLNFGDIPPEIRIVDITDVEPTIEKHLSKQELIVNQLGRLDVQIQIKVEFCGNVSFSIHSGLQVNYPSPGFASLPISLHVSECHFSGTAMLIFVWEEKALFLTFEADDDTHIGPLKNINFKSDIGDMNQNMLQNAEKVETFLLATLQTLLLKNMVFPNFLQIAGTKIKKTAYKKTNLATPKKMKRPDSLKKTASSPQLSSLRGHKIIDVANERKLKRSTTGLPLPFSLKSRQEYRLSRENIKNAQALSAASFLWTSPVKLDAYSNKPSSRSPTNRKKLNSPSTRNSTSPAKSSNNSTIQSSNT